MVFLILYFIRSGEKNIADGGNRNQTTLCYLGDDENGICPSRMRESKICHFI